MGKGINKKPLIQLMNPILEHIFDVRNWNADDADKADEHRFIFCFAEK